MTGSWLSGPGAALPRDSDGREVRYRGERLGLPQHGPGSIAGTGRRVAAITVDWLLALVVASVLTAPAGPGSWGVLVWAVVGAIAVAVFGTTPGQLALGIGVARVDATVPVGVLRSVARVVLVFLVVPPVIWDLDGRGLQDRATQTAVIRSR
jgi:hypothetical protein